MTFLWFIVATATIIVVFGHILNTLQLRDGEKGPERDPGATRVGSIVRIREVGSNEVETLRVVHKASNEPRDGYEEVASGSPVGAAIMKARAGETVRVAVPQGVRSFEVLSIE